MTYPLHPHIKMISMDFVGYVPAHSIVPGDLVLEGLVVDTERVDGNYLIAVPGGFDEYKPQAMILRFGRLTKYAFEAVMDDYRKSKD